jgi:glycosyltransferase involved in cell wall biosynthesis
LSVSQQWSNIKQEVVFTANGAFLATQSENHNIRIAWIIAGDEDGGVAQAVRGLTTAVQEMGIAPVFVSLRSAQFSEYLRGLGFDVRVLNVVPPPALRGGLASKLLLQLQTRHFSTAARRSLASALAELRATAVHVLWPNLMPLAAMAASDVGIPCIWEVSGVLGNYPFGMNRRLIQHTLRRWNVLPLANSIHTASKLGTGPVRPEVLYLGADEGRFNPAVAAAIPREQLGCPPDAVVLGVVARLEREKGQAVVLEAMAQLPEAYHNAHLLLLGGPVEGEFGDELRALAQRLGLADRLHLIGNVPDPERYYGAIDVAINAYLGAESFGLSVVEAMMMGKPVLVHALGGPAETVVDGVTGWHIHEPTVAGFRAGLIRALGEREKWLAMGAAGRQRALEHFSLSRQAKQYVEIVRKRLGS